ncbi:hypothetical protein CYLTODRAFT_285252 [Cylindrobasidium torrendii FP15055 ss-10]|uniref:Uncharacterized protein n=1 Tax=Cylindrobasidium torrendii FP15055 ss-10 TaxID=1314674 RepID=A0A0D7BTL3_9AGAR|nr:hypothetical protein CYLTODRAFT_285252 [Cylindrobasidium torrendii FP15055 ss-10]
MRPVCFSPVWGRSARPPLVLIPANGPKMVGFGSPHPGRLSTLCKPCLLVDLPSTSALVAASVPRYSALVHRSFWRGSYLKLMSSREDFAQIIIDGILNLQR